MLKTHKNMKMLYPTSRRSWLRVRYVPRMFVWRSLLCLPENHGAYSSLTDKGLHGAYLSLHNKYPIKSHKLQRGLQR